MRVTTSAICLLGLRPFSFAWLHYVSLSVVGRVRFVFQRSRSCLKGNGNAAYHPVEEGVSLSPW